jgi:hypothetical protein
MPERRLRLNRHLEACALSAMTLEPALLYRNAGIF